jgi:hypothetical protein
MKRKWVYGLIALSAVGTIGAVLALQSNTETVDPELVSYDGQDRRGGDFRIFGLTGGKTLVLLRGDDPDKVRGIGDIGGLQGDAKLIGIDFRVQDGKLYGVGDKGGVYTISTDNAKAAKVSQLSVALSGTDFDIDFNPAANRLRVVSDNGQNLRHNIDDPAGAPAAGTTANDTALSTPPTAGTTTGVTGAAYTNNDTNADTATTLYDLSTTTDQILVQSPANNGTLAPTGKLAVDAAGDAGFDIATLSKGNTAFASLKVDGRYRLFRVDLLAGRVSGLGSFPSRTQVTDIAVQTTR